MFILNGSIIIASMDFITWSNIIYKDVTFANLWFQYCVYPQCASLQEKVLFCAHLFPKRFFYYCLRDIKPSQFNAANITERNPWCCQRHQPDSSKNHRYRSPLLLATKFQKYERPYSPLLVPVLYFSLTSQDLRKMLPSHRMPVLLLINWLAKLTEQSPRSEYQTLIKDLIA